MAIDKIKLMIFFLTCMTIFTGCCGEPVVEQIADSAKSLGYSEGYCIARVTYSGGNNDTTINAMVDLIDVAGQWKITRLDITGQGELK